MSIYFAEQSWPQLEQAIAKDTLIVLPVSQIEEHGPHLPVETDDVIGRETCRRAAEKAVAEIPVLVMPSIWSGYTNKEATKWPGTIRVQPETLIALVFDVCSSLIEMGFKKIVLVNSHGQHKGILEIVARKIGDKYGVHMAVAHTFALGSAAIAAVRKTGPGGGGHACEIETSQMLYLTDLVDMSKADSIDHCRYRSKFKSNDGFTGGSKVFWSTWATESSRKGMLGDPTPASKASGEIITRAVVDELCEFLLEFYRFEGRSRS